MVSVMAKGKVTEKMCPQTTLSEEGVIQNCDNGLLSLQPRSLSTGSASLTRAAAEVRHPLPTQKKNIKRKERTRGKASQNQLFLYAVMDDFSFTLNTVNKHAIYFQHIRLMTPILWGRGEGEQIKSTCNIQHWTQDQTGRPKVHNDNTR